MGHGTKSPLALRAFELIALSRPDLGVPKVVDRRSPIRSEAHRPMVKACLRVLGDTDASSVDLVLVRRLEEEVRVLRDRLRQIVIEQLVERGREARASARELVDDADPRRGSAGGPDAARYFALLAPLWKGERPGRSTARRRPAPVVLLGPAPKRGREMRGAWFSSLALLGSSHATGPESPPQALPAGAVRQHAGARWSLRPGQQTLEPQSVPYRRRSRRRSRGLRAAGCSPA